MYQYDIFSQICKHLSDKEKIRLTMISIVTNSFKYKLIYVDQIDERQIRNLIFYDNFESVSIMHVHVKFPKNIKKLHIRSDEKGAIRTFDSNFIVPSSVTHLTLSPADETDQYRRES